MSNISIIEDNCCDSARVNYVIWHATWEVGTKSPGYIPSLGD